MEIISPNELTSKLNNFRNTVNNFDFSEVQNVTFLNLNALYTYISEVEDNPFKRQYDIIQEQLSDIIPYIPFAMGTTASEFLDKASNIQNEVQMEMLKVEFSERSKLDFIDTVRMIHSDEEWDYLISICETIRQNKERALHNKMEE